MSDCMVPEFAGGSRANALGLGTEVIAWSPHAPTHTPNHSPPPPIAANAGETIADGMACRVPDPRLSRSFSWCQPHRHSREDEIRSSMRTVLRHSQCRRRRRRGCACALLQERTECKPASGGDSVWRKRGHPGVRADAREQLARGLTKANDALCRFETALTVIIGSHFGGRCMHCFGAVLGPATLARRHRDGHLPEAAIPCPLQRDRESHVFHRSCRDPSRDEHAPLP